MASGIERVADRLPRPLAKAWVLAARTVVDSAEDRVVGLAAEAAFFALLSLPPLLVALVGLIGAIAELDTGFGREVEAILAEVAVGLPSQFLRERTIETVVVPLIGSVIDQAGAGIVSLGFAVALWSGSRAVATYIGAISIAYDLEDPRPAWKRRLLAVWVTIAGIIVGAVVLPAMVVGRQIVELVAPQTLSATVEALSDLAFYPVLGLISLLALATFYHVTVPWRTPWRRDLPGAVLAMLLWLGGSSALRTYVALTFGGDSVFGALAAPLAILLWLYVTALAVLLGAELNAEIERMWPRRPHEQPIGRTREEIEAHPLGKDGD